MYEEFYRLTEKPFQVTPDPRVLFPSREYRRALSYLHYGLEQGEGFIVISGDIGSGKTLLGQALVAQLDPMKVKAVRLAVASIRPAEVGPAVASCFGIASGGDRLNALQDLEKFLEENHRLGRSALLIVDEAQRFSREALEELRILSNMDYRGRALLQIFLLGQEELRNVLRGHGMEQFRQRIIAMHHLRPLLREEVQAYVEFRLKRVGWNGAPHIDNEVYEMAFDFTEGVPRKINLLFDRAMLFGYLEETCVINGDMLRQVRDELEREAWGPRTETALQESDVPSEVETRIAVLEERMQRLEESVRMWG